MPRVACFALLALAAFAVPPQPAQAQVRRCTASDGALVYTDRKCEDIGAVERPAAAAAVGGYRMYRRPTCARNVNDLAYTLGSALNSADVNQVAALYDFSGMATSDGYRVMDRLQVIASRTLVDVQPMYAGGVNEYGYDVVEFDPDTGAVLAKPASKPRLVGLRVEQVLADGHTPSRVVFGLRQRLGCWWVRL
ncbi:hypothetical protein MASR1M8_26440 [Thermomonas brevis]